MEVWLAETWPRDLDGALRPGSYQDALEWTRPCEWIRPATILQNPQIHCCN